MKFTILLLWLAGGGLVAFTVYTCVNLMKLCEARHEAVWDLLVPQDRA